MHRIVSIWLPHLPIERLRKAEPGAIPADRPKDGRADRSGETPFALVASEARGQVITAVNHAARLEGIGPGLTLADARTRLPRLRSRAAAPAHDGALLLRLARWIGRYGPARNCDGEDGLWVDITGVAHLFGRQSGRISDILPGNSDAAWQTVSETARDAATVCDECALLTDLAGRFARLGLTARVGLADTLGAAHALARFATGEEASRIAIAPAGEIRGTLAALPVQALRLSTDSVLLLKRLGLNRIGDLYDLPRAALERRFRDKAAAASVLARLDQALGLLAEPRRALAEPPVLCVRQSFAEPLIAAETIAAEVKALTTALAGRLDAAGQGARRIALALYRTDGSCAMIGAGTSQPCRDPCHLFALLAMRLDGVDAGFGIDALGLDAIGTEPLAHVQTALAAHAVSGNRRAAVGQLVDRLTHRLGSSRVLTLTACASHVPERAAVTRPALASLGQLSPPPVPRSASWPATGPRPPFLLARPEPIQVVAEVPEGAPARFTWRRRGHPVVKTEGPERIAPEWWRVFGDKGGGNASAVPVTVRDYYRLEDQAGGRYWVFRAGCYQDQEAETAGDPVPPAWYLHGIFP